MQVVYQHPLSWLTLTLLMALYFCFVRRKKYSITAFIITGLIFISLIPSVSKLWLESIWIVFDAQGSLCEERIINSPHRAILLPAGVINLNDQMILTEWSENRVDALKMAADKGLIEKLFIPGGDIVLSQLEGNLIKLFFSIKHEREILIEVGAGSNSTFGNFKEMLSMVDSKVKHVIYTSNWHGFRAIKVAKKFGLDTCLARVGNEYKQKSWLENAWRFRAAIREYCAIVWYWLLGRI